MLLWLSSTIVSAVNTLPLVSTCMLQWAWQFPLIVLLSFLKIALMSVPL